MNKNHSTIRNRRALRIVRAVFMLMVAMLMASCTTKAVKRQQAFAKTFEEGDYIATIEEIRKGKDKLYGATNAFLYYMDIGVLYHYAGLYDSSNVNLQRAADIYDDLFAKSITNEAAAIMTNDNVRPYRAKPYELVFMHQIAALNFMAMGKFQESLVETRKVQLHFNEWERKSGSKGKKYHSDGMFHIFSSLAYERVGEDDNSLISLYKAVEAYKMGPVKLPPAVRGFAFDRLTAGDRENDVKTLKLTDDGGADKWTAKMGQSEIVVVGYAGRGPSLAEVKWTGTYVPGAALVVTCSDRGPDGTGKPDVLALPALVLPPGTATGSTFHISLATPKVSVTDSKTSHFSAQIGGKSYKSAAVNNLDDQLKKYLEDDMAEILTRTAIRVVVRTFAAQKAKKATAIDNPLLNLAKNVAVDVGSSQLEKADTRTCFMLPKTVQLTRIPVEPGTHTVSLNVYDKSGAVIGRQEFKDVQVKKGEKKMLFHNSLR